MNVLNGEVQISKGYVVTFEKEKENRFRNAYVQTDDIPAADDKSDSFLNTSKKLNELKVAANSTIEAGKNEPFGGKDSLPEKEALLSIQVSQNEAEDKSDYHLNTNKKKNELKVVADSTIKNGENESYGGPENEALLSIQVLQNEATDNKSDTFLNTDEKQNEVEFEVDLTSETVENEPYGGQEIRALLSIQELQNDGWTPDGGCGWAIVIGGVIVHVYVGGLVKASGVMYLKLKDQFEQSAVATAWMFSLFTTFLLMMGPIASALCLRFSCRSVVFFGSILCFAGILMSAFAPNIEFLSFSYSVVGGIGRCLTYTPSLILITNYFNKRRGLAVGITTAGVGLGMFSFPPLIDALFDNYGYHGAMLLLSAISLQTCICAALFRPLELHKKISKTQRINESPKLFLFVFLWWLISVMSFWSVANTPTHQNDKQHFCRVGALICHSDVLA